MGFQRDRVPLISATRLPLSSPFARCLRRRPFVGSCAAGRTFVLTISFLFSRRERAFRHGLPVRGVMPGSSMIKDLGSARELRCGQLPRAIPGKPQDKGTRGRRAHAKTKAISVCCTAGNRRRMLTCVEHRSTHLVSRLCVVIRDRCDGKLFAHAPSSEGTNNRRRSTREPATAVGSR